MCLIGDSLTEAGSQALPFFSSPFSVDIKSVPEKLQVELIDLQADSALRVKLLEVPMEDFYCLLSLT